MDRIWLGFLVQRVSHPGVLRSTSNGSRATRAQRGTKAGDSTLWVHHISLPLSPLDAHGKPKPSEIQAQEITRTPPTTNLSGKSCWHHRWTIRFQRRTDPRLRRWAHFLSRLLVDCPDLTMGRDGRGGESLQIVSLDGAVEDQEHPASEYLTSGLVISGADRTYKPAGECS